MPPTPANFAELPAASAQIKGALAELQSEYLKTLDKTESELGRILAQSAARQAGVILQNLDAFDRRGTHLFTSGRNLQLLEDLTTALAELDVPARDSARQAWVGQALELRTALAEAAPKMGLDLRRTDFARVSLELVQVASQNNFGELSDFAQLQRGTIVNLKTGLADSMARSLDWRSIGREVEASGIEALAAIPGRRRAFSVVERGQMIGRTETVRVQTQLQSAFGEENGLEWGRSYLNWRLTRHHELCLWAESVGWAPVAEFQKGPGLPPRHPNCGCHFVRGLPEWLEKDHKKSHAEEFVKNLKADAIKVSPALFDKLHGPILTALELKGPELMPSDRKLMKPFVSLASKKPTPFAQLGAVPQFPGKKPKAPPGAEAAAPTPAPVPVPGPAAPVLAAQQPRPPVKVIRLPQEPPAAAPEPQEAPVGPVAPRTVRVVPLRPRGILSEAELTAPIVPLAPIKPKKPKGPPKPKMPKELDLDELQKVDLHQVEPTWQNPPGFGPRYGTVLFDAQGRVLLREPANHFDQYHWTFPKGKQEAGDHPSQTAVRETMEETGHEAALVGLVPGGFKGGSSTTFFFLGKSNGEKPEKMDQETASTKWATVEEAKELIGQTTNQKGRERDLKVLDAAAEAWGRLKKGEQAAGLQGLKTLTDAQAKKKDSLKAKAEEKAQKKAAKEAEKAEAIAARKVKELERQLKALDREVEQDTSPLPKPEDFPEDPEALELVRRLGGSTGAELVRDRSTGKQYVRKRGKDPGHLLEEAAADKAYQALGVRVPSFRVYQGPKGPVKLAEFIEGQSLASALKDSAKAPKVLEALRRDFAADALLGNWDVAGMDLDNVLVDGADRVWRIDNGGGLRRRGMGQVKTSDEWHEHPEELWTMRDEKVNPRAARLFGDLSIFDIGRQARELVRFRDRLSGALPAELRPTVMKRLETMLHVGRTAGLLEADRWQSGYVNDFTRHQVGFRKAGVVERLPLELKGNDLYRDHKDRFGFKEHETRGLVDEKGKKWDNLRGKGGVMEGVEQYVKKAGGDWKAFSAYIDAQSGSSWSHIAQGAKYFVATRMRDVAPSGYYWMEGEGNARNSLQEQFSKFGEAKYSTTMAAAHAFNYELLLRARFPNKVGREHVAVVRTEERSVMSHYKLKVGDKDKTIVKGALDSYSIFKAIQVRGSEVTLQLVPLHRVLMSYFPSRAGGEHSDMILGDGENEFVIMAEGVPLDYLPWKVR